jgi:hypothetical protein
MLIVPQLLVGLLALFYKTLNGAGVGDLFMSLIHTSELNDANPLDYLTELQRHVEEIKQKPWSGCRGISVLQKYTEKEVIITNDLT